MLWQQDTHTRLHYSGSFNTPRQCYRGSSAAVPTTLSHLISCRYEHRPRQRRQPLEQTR